MNDMQDDSPPPKRFFEGCCCPHCKAKMDEVDESAKHCPRCDGRLEAHDVWKTKRYQGLFVLPGWVTAFGWPLLVLLGCAFFILVQFLAGSEVVRIPTGFIGVGLVWFFIKLFTSGER